MPDRNFQVGLSFTVDASKARQELEKLKNDLSNAISTAKIGENTTAKFDEAIRKAAQLKGILEGATDPFGNFNLTKFRQELDKSNMSMRQVNTVLKEIGAVVLWKKLSIVFYLIPIC